jgi:hypothetical protein
MSNEEREMFFRFFQALETIDQHLHKIMATNADIVVQLNQVNTNLQAANVEIAKVGAEQDTLIQKISDLQAIIAAGGAASPELVAAAQAVADQAGVVATGLDAIDAKVPDAVAGAPAAAAVKKA